MKAAVLLLASLIGCAIDRSPAPPPDGGYGPPCVTLADCAIPSECWTGVCRTKGFTQGWCDLSANPGQPCDGGLCSSLGECQEAP